jgi:O-antigen/teichoic acid export membrane protein
LEKKKLLLENVFVYGLSNFISKIIPFLFLPVILNLLNSPSNYAIYTSFITIVGLFTPLVNFAMQDAVFREYFEIDEVGYQKKVLSTSLTFVIFTSFVLSLIFLLYSEFISFMFGIDDMTIIYLSLISIVCWGFIDIISLPTRLKNDKKTFVIMSSIIPIILNLLSLLTLLIGLSFYGLIISYVVINFISLIIYLLLNIKQFDIKLFSSNILKKLLKIATPLVPSLIIYWLYNSLDRIMIVQFLGLYELGIYSVAAKFGSIGSLIYVSFASGIKHFSFSTMKDLNQIESNSKLLNFVLLTSSLIFGIMILSVELLFNLILPVIYFSASSSAIYLFMSPLLIISFQVAGNQFLILRKSKFLLLSLIFGLTFNLILNFTLIPIYGILGASISTFFGFYISLISIIILASLRKLVHLDLKLILNLIIILSFAFVLFFINNSFIKFNITLLLFITILLLDFDILKTLFHFIWSILRPNLKNK